MTDTSIPLHIGYILDGNRRWAKAHGLPAYEGHMAGYNKLQDIVEATFDAGVKYVSAYIFSTENWKRSQDEVSKLMKLVLKLLTTDLVKLEEKNIRLVIMGSRDMVSDEIVKAIEEAEERTKDNAAGTLALCFNYGGQLELVEAVKNIIHQDLDAEEVTVETIAENLYHPEVPACDLIVRTSNEQRLSNFMMWRSAYSEFLFLEKNWPEMTTDDVAAILEEYASRNRRIGG